MELDDGQAPWQRIVDVGRSAEPVPAGRTDLVFPGFVSKAQSLGQCSCLRTPSDTRPDDFGLHAFYSCLGGLLITL